MGGIIDKVANIGQTSSADRAATATRDAAAAAGQAAQVQEEQLKKSVGFAQSGLRQLDATLAPLLTQNDPRALNEAFSAINAQKQNVSRQQELFQSLDPAIMEASQQALQLLRGEESKALGPLRQQRQTQRQALLDRLREQLGPGAETSTAGIQALNQFDQQTDSLVSGAQQQTLGQIFGIAQTGAQGRSALNQGASTLGGLAGQASSIQAQNANTRLGAAGLRQQGVNSLVNAQQGLASGSGSQFVEAQLGAQGRLQQAQTEFASNAAIGGQLMGGLFGASVGRAGAGIADSIFGPAKKA